jgi:hypothetical protein
VRLCLERPKLTEFKQYGLKLDARQSGGAHLLHKWNRKKLDDEVITNKKRGPVLNALLNMESDVQTAGLGSNVSALVPGSGSVFRE